MKQFIEYLKETELNGKLTEGNVEFEFHGDDGESIWGEISYKTMTDKKTGKVVVDPNSLQADLPGDGVDPQSKLNDQVATDFISPGGGWHKDAMDAIQDEIQESFVDKVYGKQGNQASKHGYAVTHEKDSDYKVWKKDELVKSFDNMEDVNSFLNSELGIDELKEEIEYQLWWEGEEIDSFTSKEEASAMKSEYEMAFNSPGGVSIKRAKVVEEPEDDSYDEHDWDPMDADADTLASAGYGTDEDYGYYGESADDFSQGDGGPGDIKWHKEYEGESGTGEKLYLYVSDDGRFTIGKDHKGWSLHDHRKDKTLAFKALFNAMKVANRKDSIEANEELDRIKSLANISVKEDDLPRQLKDPEKEMMITKPNKDGTDSVIVIDKDEWDAHRSEGWTLAEQKK
jgi:hypothetical protein